MSGLRSSRDRMPRDDRRDDRYNVSSDTNSTDPALLNARVFVGNVHFDNTSREEMNDRFAKYGKILGISLHRGFSFVQYANEEDAVLAVRKEHCTNFKGAIIEVNLAKERRRDGDRGPGNLNSNQMDRRSPPSSEDDLPKERRWSYRQMPAQREVLRDRSPIRIGNPFVDGYRENRGNDNKYMPRGGGDSAAPVPSYREDTRDIFAPRNPNEIPGIMGQRAEEAVRSSGGMDSSVPYERELGRNRSHTSSGGSAGLRAGNSGPSKQPNDCEIIALTKNQRGYAEMVETRLRNLGLRVDLLFPHEDSQMTVSKILDNISKSGCLYAIVISPQNEMHGSLILHILHGVPQEHRNMPLDDAMRLVDRNFANYMRSKKAPPQPEVATNTRVQQPQQVGRLPNVHQQNLHLQQQQHIAIQQPESQLSSRATNMDYYDPLQQHHNVLNQQQQPIQQQKPVESKMQPLLSLLANNKPLTVLELDLVIGHLQEQRAILLGRDPTAGPVHGQNYAKPEKSKSGELPPHILELISTNTNPLGAQSAKDPAKYISPLAKLNPNAQTFINFSNPSVQKALDNLMQGGPSNILRSVEAAGGNSGMKEAGGSNGGMITRAGQQPVAMHRHPLLGVPANRRGLFSTQRM